MSKIAVMYLENHSSRSNILDFLSFKKKNYDFKKSYLFFISSDKATCPYLYGDVYRDRSNIVQLPAIIRQHS